MEQLEERGHATFEYAGLIVVVAGIIAALVGLLPGSFTRAVERAVCAVAARTCTDHGAARPHDSPNRAGEEDGHKAFPAPSPAASHLARAPARPMSGGTTEEETRGIRDSLPENTPAQVDTMLTASPGRFDDLVDNGTQHSSTDGWLAPSDRNWRYFRTEPGDDDGMVVYDFFISGETSGHFIAGDDRGFPEDGGALSVPMDKSRFRVVIDRSTGRGVVIQSKSTMNGLLEGLFQNEAQPIAIDEEGVLKDYDFPNHYSVDADGDSVSLEYEGVNSITRGPDVQGNVRIRRADNGTWKVADRSGDTYPSVGVYYYEPSGSVQTALEHEQNSDLCAFPIDCEGSPSPDGPRHPPTEPGDGGDGDNDPTTPRHPPTGPD